MFRKKKDENVTIKKFVTIEDLTIGDFTLIREGSSIENDSWT
jgi:UDP-3-O-[3-hydroxymyristoyl] glucosamine N-acyltransferase